MFIPTDYEIELDMIRMEILKEIWASNSIDDFSEPLKKVALQFKESLTE